MARKISSFGGTTCIVGRGWAPRYKVKSYGIKVEAPSWYHFDPDEHHDPGKSYYIDILTRCAADLVIDFSQPLSSALIPDDRFELVILEYLPTNLLTDRGCSTLSNAKRILKTGGKLEVHSGKDVLIEVAGILKGMSFSNITIDNYPKTLTTPASVIRRHFDPTWNQGDHVEDTSTDKLIATK